MSLKAAITKAEFDKLSDILKTEYTVDGDEYKLDVDGIEDAGPLKRALDREKENKKELQKKNKELEERLNGVSDADARKAGDIEKLERAAAAKLAKERKELEDVIAGKDAHIKSFLVDAVATKMASEISTAPALLLPHIKERLMADLSGDKPVTRVLDADGNVTSKTPADLQKEFVANKDFASIIIGSRATGGGAGGQRGGGGASGNGKKLPDMTETERIELFRADPAEFERLTVEAKRK